MNDKGNIAEQVSKGIVYVATGERYIQEAIRSAASCRKTNSYPIALITDAIYPDIPAGTFDQIIQRPAVRDYRDKLLMRHSPFEHTIFLDTDTLITGELSGLFRILDFREFAIHQADEGYEFDMPELSSAMPEFNTGVIAFRLTAAVDKLFDDWALSFEKHPNIRTDQYHLRKTLYASQVRYATFSSAYNFIIYHTNLVMQEVRIFHGRPFETLEAVARDVNHIRHEDGWRRAYFPYQHQFGMIYKHMVNGDLSKLLRFSMRGILANWLRPLIRRKK